MSTLTPSDRGVYINQVYSQLDRKFEEQETQRKAAANHLPYINLYGFPVDAGALALIPEDEARQLEAVVFFKEARNLKLGILAPSAAVDKLVSRLREKSFYVETYQISKSSLRHLVEGYKSVVVPEKTGDEINLLGKELNQSDVASLAEVGRKISSKSATEIIDFIMTAALGLESSDVHIEPNAHGLTLRFRIDGVLQDVAQLELALHHPIISRIKILSKLKLNIVAVPQDGSFSLQYNNSPVDVRVSVLPSAFGESLVMRLLRHDKGTLRFSELGISGLAHERLVKEMRKPNGMILTTGPTGSGKTTTLYAILNELNEPGVKIITLEDPVEYKIPGITQTPIDANAGLTFAAGLRSILRQDPDMVMVGEMRDLETAEIACQAAMTGHIVLSTLHTNDAASALPRLMDLGVKPFILAPAVNAIIAQRLVRRICQFCKTEHRPDKTVMDRMAAIIKAIPKAAQVKLPREFKLYHSTGCPKCNGLGYKGRMGVYEVLVFNEAIERLIQERASTSTVRNQAIEDGMITMAQDGLIKALAGVTDIQEVFRVTEE